MPARKRRRGWLFRLTALALSLLFALGVGEAAARWLNLAPPWHPAADTALVLHYQKPTDTIRLNPGWEGYVGFVWTRINEAGFRDRTYSSRPSPGTTRIAVLGDSYTMGDAVELEDTYPKQVEQRLADRNCEVMNCGTSATNSQNQLGTLRRVLDEYQPHIVVLGYNLNDFYYPRETRFETLEKAGYLVEVGADGRVTVKAPPLSGLGRIKDALRQRSYLYRWLVRIRDHWSASPEEAAQRDPVALVAGWVQEGGHLRSFAAVEEMKRYCDQRQVAFLVMILPDLLDVPATTRTMREYSYLREHEMILREFHAREVLCFDALPRFVDHRPRELAAHPFDRHFNREGHRLLADALTAQLGSMVPAPANPAAVPTRP